MVKDYYWILGIGSGASQKQVEIAYHTRFGELRAKPRQDMPLLDVQEAYSVLGDPSRRRAYDLSPHKVPIQSQRTESGKPPIEPLVPRDRGRDVIDVSVLCSFRTARPSFDEIHDRLWSNFHDVPVPKSETVESLTLEIPIATQQALTGGRARVLVPARTKCPACGGQGGVGLFACLRCEGSGAFVGEYPILVEYPAGITDYAVQIPLDRFGIHNVYLNVLFRVTHDLIE
jgi:DnaJ-class molecular chaperone